MTVNKYITAGFVFNWKSIKEVKELSEEFGVDLEDVELIVNGIKTSQNTYNIRVYARVVDSDNVTYIHKVDGITEETIAKANGIAGYYSALVQKSH